MCLQLKKFNYVCAIKYWKILNSHLFLVKFTPLDYMQIKFECVCPTPLMFN